MLITEEIYLGCVLGLALGDAIGAPFEGDPIGRCLWKLIGKTKSGRMRWTDDTQMTKNIGESLLSKNGILDLDDLAMRFAVSYRWSRGYGPAAAKLLKKIRRGVPWQTANRLVYPQGSFGNGGAMRAPLVGLFFASQKDKVITNAKAIAGITHAHPLGLEGAALIALSSYFSITRMTICDFMDELIKQSSLEPYTKRLNIAKKWLLSNEEIPPSIVKKELGNRMIASESCVTAIYLALRFRDKSFMEMIQFLIKIKGDVDTIAAMAGAIWGVHNGPTKLPENYLLVLEQREDLQEMAKQLYVISQPIKN